MRNRNKSLVAIKKSITRHARVLQRIHEARQEVRGYTSLPLAVSGAAAKGTLKKLGATPSKRVFKLLAQGDSWFDYPPGTDLIDCLNSEHGHSITNLAVAGSTLNDEAYGPVPRQLFGLPIPLGRKRSEDPDRITELVHHIQQTKPQALLLSAGGNDVAGNEFFSFLNNANSQLPAVNADVLNGVVNGTFKAAYQYLLDTALAAAGDSRIAMPIFIHGYDYPWPDGRALNLFFGWKIGPWFDEAFSLKNYPNRNGTDLAARRRILVQFIDAVNNMQKDLVASPRYAGKVFYVNLVGTLRSVSDWANELHPANSGFRALAAKFDAALQKNI